MQRPVTFGARASHVQLQNMGVIYWPQFGSSGITAFVIYKLCPPAESAAKTRKIVKGTFRAKMKNFTTDRTEFSELTDEIRFFQFDLCSSQY